ncbi:MAG: sialidase family protein, partial [Bacteroidota bacterium]
MKIYSTLLLALLLLLCADSFLPSKSSKSRKERHIGLAYELEFEQTRDLKTNTIPSERLFAAKEFADQKRRQKSVANIQWEERGPNNVGGRTRTLLYDLNDPSGNTVFAGSVGGGLWRTNNINTNPVDWQPVDNFWSNIAIGSIAQNPENPNEIYVGTGEGWFNGDSVRGNGIWKSEDGGNTWQQLPRTRGMGYVNKLVVARNGVVLAAIRDVFVNQGGIYRSEDGGSTWTPVIRTPESFSMGADIEIAANGDIYASMGILYSDGIYKSLNNGLTWTKVYNSKSNEFRIELACAPSNPNVVYALFENGSENGIPAIRKTSTGGARWQDVNTPLWYDQNCSSLERDWTRGQDWFDLIAIVDPTDENSVYIGAVDLFKTQNGGNSWTQISHWYTSFSCGYPPERTVHADQHAMVFKPGSNSELLFGNDGGVYQTTNANTRNPENIRFNFKSDNYNVTQFYATATSNEAGGNRFLAGAQDNGTQYYRAVGMNSTREVTGGDGAFCHIDEDNPNIQISSYVYNNYFITNNAWSGFTSKREGNVGRFINPSDYDSRSNTLYAAHEEGKYLSVRNVGTSNSTTVKAIEEMEGVISAVSVSPNEPNRVFFATSRGELLKVDDIHSNFLTTVTIIDNGLPFGYISSITMEKGNDNHIIISYSNYGLESIWETTDGGVNWTNVEGDLP